ncbi:helix-turn-helix domain-containing protein [Candidatus Omnitrophota bacterium]
MQKRLIGVKEAAVYLGVEVSTVYSWVNKRFIPHFKIGRLVKFDVARIEDWIDKRSVDEYEAN